jgi:aminopeptidase N
MLRIVAGDDAFFSALKKFFTEFKGKKAALDDIRRSFEIVCRMELDWFFDQWFKRAGYPVLRVSWKQSGSELLINIIQEQDGYPYRVALQLGIETDGQKKTVDVVVAKKSERFPLEFSNKVVKVHVANARDILVRVLVD